MNVLKFNINYQSGIFCFSWASMILITTISIVALQHISFIIFLDVEVEYHDYLQFFFLFLILLLPFSFYIGWYSKKIKRHICEKLIEKYANEMYLTNLVFYTSRKLLPLTVGDEQQDDILEQYVSIENKRKEKIQSIEEKVKRIQNILKSY